MRTSHCSHRAVEPQDSVERDGSARACGDQDPLNIGALTAPGAPSLDHNTQFRALYTWTKWEKCAPENIEDKYKILPPFLFQKPILSREAERKLIAQAQAEGPEADESRTTVLEANLRFVRHIAVRYGKLATPSLSVEDLFQEGIFGINRAIDLYDPAKNPNGRFTTYAASHIWAAMQRAITSASDTVYYPIRQRGAAWAILRTAERLTQTLGRDPTYGEISEQTDITHASLGITPDFITYLFAEGILQSHPPAENDYKEHYPHLLPAKDIPTPEDISRTQELQRIAKIIDECCTDFSEREVAILKMRYPLDPDQDPKTLEEVGEHFGCSKPTTRE